MKQFIYFAQAANYNCADASNSAYGAGNSGTCATTAATSTTQQVGAPQTGEFFGFVTSGAFSIILPLIVAIVAVAIASIVFARKKAR